MKPEVNPSDLFAQDNFVTADHPGAGLSEKEQELMKHITKAGVQPLENNIPIMHNEEQMINTVDRQQINQKFDRTFLAEEKAKMAADSVKDRMEPITSPQDIFKSLISFGDHRQKVKLYQHTWELRCLDQSDILAASDEINDYAEGRMGYLTSYTFSKLVYSIEGIDGISIYNLFSDIDYKQFPSKVLYITAVKRALRSWLLALPDIIITDLIDAYLDMENKRAEEIRKLKNS